MKTPNIILNVVLTMAMVVSCSPQKQEYILFSSGRSGTSGIYLMDSEGEKVQKIYDSSDEEWAPVWLNDSKISFLQQKGEVIDRVIYDIETQQKDVIPNQIPCRLDDKNALYKPQDGTQLILCGGEIYIQVVNQEPELLTDVIEGTANYPSWSPDGKSILFTSNHEGSNDIYRMDILDKSIERLTSNPGNDERASFSPDMSKIVFSTEVFDDGNQEIAILDLKNDTLINISKSSGLELIGR